MPSSYVHSACFALYQIAKYGVFAHPNITRRISGMASSSAVISSGLRFRQRLIQLGYVAQNNAKHLFPGRVRPPKTVSEIHAHNRRPQPLKEFKTSNFASEIIAFANEVETFIERLRRFQIVSEFDSSLHALRTKLQYLGKSLTKIYKLFNKDKDDAASFLEVRLHMHNRLADIGEYFDNITSSLEILRTAGMPAIHIYQQHAAENLSSLATVATLFAGVAATTIQFTWDMEPRTKVSTITVNVLWFASLVLSVAAAVDSTLVKAWRLSMYQSSREDIPWLVFVWVHHSAPLVFLVLSVASFSIGLCVFTYASNQHFITFVLTTLLTAMTSVGLMIISTWVSFEQLAKYEDDDFERGSKADLSAILTLAHRRFQQWREAVIDRKEASPTQEESKWELARPGLLSHEALVHDLQFSPDGRYLATASWDKYASIYAVNDPPCPAPLSPSDSHRQFSVLEQPHIDDKPEKETSPKFRLHHERSLVHQVRWAPDNQRIATRTGDCIKLWQISEDGPDEEPKPQKELKLFNERLRSIVWWPDSNSVLAVTSYRILRLDVDAVAWQEDTATIYKNFEPVKLRGVVVMTNDYLLVIGVPGKEEKSTLAVYSIKLQTLKGRRSVTELSSDVRAVVIAQKTNVDEYFFLVSYANQVPPELWKVEKLTVSGDSWSFKRIRTYRTWEITDASRNCCFGGAEDEFILCAGKDGGIFRWDRASGELLDHIALEKTFSCLAWKKGSIEDDTVFIATGEHDGDVKIWRGKKGEIPRVSSPTLS